MYAFKVVTTVFLGILIALCGYVSTKEKDSKSGRYVGFAFGIVLVMAIGAIWL